MSTTKEAARLNVRLRPEIKKRIERAAVISGKTVSEFAVGALADLADQVLEHHQVTQLSDRDRDIFLKILDRPSKPNSRLKRAARTYKRLIVK
ncbi:MAG: DUF1778 domain-containing protein [Pyrinomonadaceae bacterium]